VGQTGLAFFNPTAVKPVIIADKDSVPVSDKGKKGFLLIDAGES
jgi:hypothetical protein